MAKLTKEEREIERSIMRGEWKSAPKSEVRRLQKIVREAMKKDKRINIRLSSQDLDGMRERALQEGIPYQTLMASIIHKYVTGRLVDMTVRGYRQQGV